MIKRVGSCLYAHSSNIDELCSNLRTPMDERVLKVVCSACNDIDEPTFKANSFIVKVNIQTYKVSLIVCSTWNTLYEPIVERSYRFDLITGKVKIVKDGKRVYHHRWMFVQDNYTGFDVEEAKKRSEILESIPEFKNKSVKRQIGNVEYWRSFLRRYDLPLC